MSFIAIHAEPKDGGGSLNTSSRSRNVGRKVDLRRDVPTILKWVPPEILSALEEEVIDK